MVGINLFITKIPGAPFVTPGSQRLNDWTKLVARGGQAVLGSLPICRDSFFYDPGVLQGIQAQSEQITGTSGKAPVQVREAPWAFACRRAALRQGVLIESHRPPRCSSATRIGSNLGSFKIQTRS